MNIATVISCLENLAHPSYQESYDNAGLLTGSSAWDCSGVLLAIDSTAEIIEEAIQKKCNLVIAHHPIIFRGLKKINGRDYVEKAVILAIKHDIAIYAIHTNLDNIISGVNGRMADKLGLINRKVLQPGMANLKKLFSFVPEGYAEQVRSALFAAGAGQIGNYSEASFNAGGTGTYKAGEGAQPFKGSIGIRHEEQEVKVEVVFPGFLQEAIIKALILSHPYEEVAYDVVDLSNPQNSLGSGLIGQLARPIEEGDFLALLKSAFGLSVIRHTSLTGKPVHQVAICGGSGSFLITKALSLGAHFYITSDIKYHEFFDANGRMVLADIGHFESEQFTIELLHEFLLKKFPTFAVLKPVTNTNPVHYYL